MKFAILLTSSSVIFLLSLPYATSLFTQHFRQFLAQKYGRARERDLSRIDLGKFGSFGGGNTNYVASNQTKKRPVIFVHGLGTIAQDNENNKKFFLERDYLEEEIYATSYGFGEATLFTDAITCQHVRRNRLLIEAVFEYTNSKVDIIAYSMGSPTARKAILGGSCVDTNEELGAPLTSLVHTFIGVGDDEVVGYKVCGDSALACEIPGQKQSFEFGEDDLLGHYGTLYWTLDLQYNLTTRDQF
uniref:Lipase n=1 Tax=Ditylenchus dipsaci TaxID=166011 RepID=A0A915D721_9BILA